MKCFVISPIGPEGSEIRHHADLFYQYIVLPAVTSFSFTAIRADMICGMSPITSDIYQMLRDSELVIADITDFNPNVYYELGFRLAFDKNCIIMREKGSKTRVPFDISNLRYLEYSLNVGEAETSVELLKNFIRNTDFASVTSIDALPLRPLNEFEGGIVIKSSNGKDHLNFTIGADGNWRIG